MTTEALRAALDCLDGVAKGDYDGNAAEIVGLLRAALAQPSTEPVAWMRDTGEPSISTMAYCIPDSVKQVWLKANPMQVERYTVPLYAASTERAPLHGYELAKVVADAGAPELNSISASAVLSLIRAIERAHGIGEKE